MAGRPRLLHEFHNIFVCRS